MSSAALPPVAPLSPPQLRRVVRLVQAYAAFWDAPAFLKGVSQPFADREAVEPFLEEAAEVVVRLRDWLDATRPAPRRILEGSSAEFFFSLRALPAPKAFVRGLVHHTFLHGSLDYVEDLTKAQVDAFIDAVEQFNAQHEPQRAKRGGAVTESELLAEWNEADLLIKSLVSPYLDKEYNPQLVQEARIVVSAVRSLKRKAEAIMEEEKALKKKAEEKQAEGDGEKAKEKEEVARRQEEKEKQEKARAEQEARKKADRERLEREKKQPDEAREEKEKKVAEHVGMLKVRRVEEDSAVIEEDIKELTQLASLVSSRATLHPQSAALLAQQILVRVAQYGNQLEQDLLALDEVVGLQNIREEKKHEVQHIQRLIEQVDKLKGAMQGLKAAAVEASKAKGEEKGKEEEKEKKRKREEDEEEKASKKQKVEEKEENDEGEEELDEEDKMEIDAEEGSAPPPLSLGDVWKHVRLEPRFQVEEDDKEFAVTANIPNLNEEDLSLRLEKGRHLHVSGLRLPTEAELAVLRSHVLARLPYASPSELNENIVRLGLGRFGAFEKSYVLPETANSNAISARYHQGTLTIIIPKHVQAPSLPRPRPPSTPTSPTRPRLGSLFGPHPELFWFRR